MTKRTVNKQVQEGGGGGVVAEGGAGENTGAEAAAEARQSHVLWSLTFLRVMER